MNSHLCYYHPLTHLAPINHKPLPSSITIGIYSQIDDLASHFTLPIKLHTSFGELNLTTLLLNLSVQFMQLDWLLDWFSSSITHSWLSQPMQLDWLLMLAQICSGPYRGEKLSCLFSMSFNQDVSAVRRSACVRGAIYTGRLNSV